MEIFAGPAVGSAGATPLWMNRSSEFLSALSPSDDETSKAVSTLTLRHRTPSGAKKISRSGGSGL
jgi:hypothetical protein